MKLFDLEIAIVRKISKYSKTVTKISVKMDLIRFISIILFVHYFNEQSISVSMVLFCTFVFRNTIMSKCLAIQAGNLKID